MLVVLVILGEAHMASTARTEIAFQAAEIRMAVIRLLGIQVVRLMDMEHCKVRTQRHAVKVTPYQVVRLGAEAQYHLQCHRSRRVSCISLVCSFSTC